MAVRALYGRSAAAEGAEFGMLPSDFSEDESALWEENWPAVQLFSQNSTQWIQGPGGPAGLNYVVLFHELDRRGLSRDEYDDMMACIRHIEQAALAEIHRDRK